MTFSEDFSFRQYLDTGAALMQAMGPFADGSISNFACNISNYLCTNFGAFTKNCTIDQLINIRSTIYIMIYQFTKAMTSVV